MITDHTDLLRWMKEHERDGIIVEIGTLTGTGTMQIAEIFPNHKILTVDKYDISSDPTRNEHGDAMADYYRQELAGKDQLDVVFENIGWLTNVAIVMTDSKYLYINRKIFFALIDGNHTPEYIKNDFWKVWPWAKFVAFHDYNHDLPRLTETVDMLVANIQGKIHKFGNYLVVENLK